MILSLVVIQLSVCTALAATLHSSFSPEDSVQFALPGAFTAPFDYLNTIPPTGLDLDSNQQIDIIPTCSCQATPIEIPNNTNWNTAFFQDQIIIATGISGQVWSIAAVSNAWDVTGRNEITIGQAIPEVGSTGVYVLPIAHQDALGYTIAVQNEEDYPDQLFGPVQHTCFYPDPIIPSLDSEYCDTDDQIILSGWATSDNDGNVSTIPAEVEEWQITRLEDQSLFGQDDLFPIQLGPGNYQVAYYFDAGSIGTDQTNTTGCAVTVLDTFKIRETALACAGAINVVLNPGVCEIQVTPAMLLANNPTFPEDYIVEVVDQYGNSLGNQIPASMAGMTLPASVRAICTNLPCFSTITIQDFSPPVLQVPADTTIACTADPDVLFTGMATAEDCTDYEIAYTDEVVERTCGNPRVEIKRTWTATDISNNTTTDVQHIYIDRADRDDFYFPPNIDISCSEFNGNPGIADPVPTGAGMPTLLGEPLCGLASNWKDDTLSICGGEEASFLILRTWLVVDICGGSFFYEDANGEDNVQIIRIVDDAAPELEASSFSLPALLPTIENGLGTCSSTGFIPPPQVFDGCNADYEIRIFTPFGEAIYTNGIDGSAGGNIPFPGLTIGTHTITYQAKDDCGNIGTLDVQMEVVDNQPPIMICNNRVTVPLQEGGLGRLFSAAIDEGSTDDCCFANRKIKLATESDEMYRDFIDFSCPEDSLWVLLRVTDCFGNYNECTSLIFPQDRNPPIVIHSYPDTSLSCLDDYSQFEDPDFQAPEFEDECSFETTFTLNIQLDSCGIGRLTRTWTASDGIANDPVVVIQEVQLLPNYNYHLQLPSDISTNCTEMDLPDMTWTTMGCELVSYSIAEEIIPNQGSDACYVLRRRHQVINWCEYDENTDPLILPRWDGLDPDNLLGDAHTIHISEGQVNRVLFVGEELIAPANGFYQYDQIVEVWDTTAATILFNAPAPFCTAMDSSAVSGLCFGSVYVPFQVQDNCVGPFTIFHSLNYNRSSIVTDIYGNLNTQNTNQYEISGNYPIGEHAFWITVIDACGNLSQFEIPFEVRDCTAPQIACASDTIIALYSDGTLLLEPIDLLEASSDDCSALMLSFSADTLDTVRAFDCTHLDPFSLAIWATDAQGNQSNCTVALQLVDNSGICSDAYKLEGQIKTENGLPVKGAQFWIDGAPSAEVMQDTAAHFELEEVPAGDNLRLQPIKNYNHVNGVSTLDIILIRRHITAVKVLDSPYKMIAADVNKSGTISTLDAVWMKRLILGIDTSFAQNTSWRFVPANYEFSDPSNPFLDEFPEWIALDQIHSDTTIHFIGMKVGDVNENANPELIQALSPRAEAPSTNFLVSNAYLEEGTSYQLLVTPEEEQLDGYQLTLSFDPQYMQFQSLDTQTGISDQNYNLNQVEEGWIRISWHRMANETGVLALNFDVLQSTPLREVLTFSNSLIAKEAYQLTEKEVLFFTPTLSFINADFQLFQNEPNPFHQETRIKFQLPEASQVTLSIFDVKGQELYQKIAFFRKGMNEIILQKEIFAKGSGLYFYRLQTPDGGTVTKKLLLIDE